MSQAKSELSTAELEERLIGAWLFGILVGAVMYAWLGWMAISVTIGIVLLSLVGSRLARTKGTESGNST